MGRNRQLSAKLRTDEKVNDWPIELRYFWTQLWGYCDDYGRGRYEPRLILADCFPLDDEVDRQRIGRWMNALERTGVIEAYQVGDRKYFYCVNWSKYQKFSRPVATDIPEPPASAEQLHADAEHVHADAGKSPAKGEGEGEVEEEVEGGRETRVTALTPFCQKHPSGTDTPCRACGNARRAYDAHLLAEKSKPTPTPKINRARFCDAPGHTDYPLPCARCERDAEVPEGNQF